MATVLALGCVAVLVTMIGGAGQASAAGTPAPSQPISLRAINSVSYMPVEGPWTNMWVNFNATQIDSDFGRISALGANTVRLLVSPTAFGFPTINTTMAQELSQVMTLAANHNLHVEMTLFDWFGSYSNTAGSEQWITSLLSPYANDPQVAFIELKNEIDPTDPSAMSWAQTMIPALRSVIGNIPVTLSTPGSQGLGGLQALKTALASTPPDFYDYHFYGTGGQAYSTLASAQQIAAPSPLVIGETGMSTYSTTGTGPTLESQQASFFSLVESATTALGMPSAEPWMLTDVDPAQLPAIAQGPNDVNQCYFGLYRADGTPKPAVAVVQAAFTGATAPVLMNLGFETTSGGVPTGWSATAASTGTLTTSGSVTRNGTDSVAISQSGSSPVAAWTQTANIGAITTGEEIQATVWAKGANSTGSNQLAVSWYGTTGNYLGNVTSPALPSANTNWTELGANATAPSGAASAVVYLQSTSNTGTVYFDDANVTIVGSGAFPALPPVPKTSGIGPTLTNTSFETGTGSTPTGWSTVGSARLASSTTVVHSGSRSVAISQTGSVQAAWTQTVNTGPLTTGTKLQATVWAQGANFATGNNNLALSWYGPSGNYLGNAISSAMPAGNTNWIELGANATAPDGAAYATVYLQSTSNSGTVYFDDANVTIVGSGAFPALPPVPKTSGVGPTLTNTSFEAGTGSAPSNWSKTGSALSAWSTTVVHSGSRSVAISQTGSVQAAWTQTVNTGPLTTGTKLQATVWAQGANFATGNNNLALSWYGPSGNYLGNAISSAMPAGNTNWIELGANATAPDGAAYATVYLQSTSNSGTVYFDDANVTIVGSGAFPALPPVPKTSGVGPTLTNTSFEAGTGSAPSNWSKRGSSGVTTWSEAVHRSGTHSVSISQSDAQTAWAQTANTGAIAVGEEILATVWAQGANSTGSNVLTISWYGPTGTYLGNALSSQLPSGDTPWTQLTVHTAAPAGAASAAVYLQSTSNIGTVYFDDADVTLS